MYLPTPDDCMSLIITECVNTKGSAIAPMIIVKGMSLLKCYFIDLPNDYLVVYSISSYINNKLSLK